jgi:hypothetical protein
LRFCFALAGFGALDSALSLWSWNFLVGREELVSPKAPQQPEGQDALALLLWSWNFLGGKELVSPKARQQSDGRYATEQHTCKRDSVCDELWS